ncbi:hypothetical protein LCGC14_1776440 [marine sediment metagenome]|uniref:Uncharacterized protein n=1 Tax=marine sediment metagenome TaxID=412755 RepID=A0A0F9JBL0_9ZZZZ
MVCNLMKTSKQKEMFRKRYPQFANTPIMFCTDWCKQWRHTHNGKCGECIHREACDSFISCGMEIFRENKRKKNDDFTG